MMSKRGQVLRATLCEIERGLFHVSYRSDTADRRVGELPIYQVGASASDARQRIEQWAHGCGFDQVIWIHAPAELARPAAQPAADAACVSTGD
jgi:hypothetical protein